MLTTVATVNGNHITKFELDNSIQEYSLQLHGTTVEDLSKDKFADLKKAAMEKLILWELIHEAICKEGGSISVEEVDRELNVIAEEFEGPDAFFQHLDSAGLNREVFRKFIAKDLIVKQKIDSAVAQAPEPTEEQIKGEYQRYFDDVAAKEAVSEIRARHILIRVGADADEEERAKALERIHEIKEMNQDFAALAKQYSNCPSASNGGDLGFFSQGVMDPAFEEAAFSQDVGVVGEVVASFFGYHLIKVEERAEQEIIPLEEAKPRIREVIREQSGVGQLREWAKGLKAKAEIEMADEVY